jgi:mannose-1-phosphate guanylyltransferase
MEHLPELPQENILCEPSMNNTAPCIAYTALRINSVDPQAIFAVLPSDHVILKEDEYVRKLDQAFGFASAHEAIVTLGIQPSRPDTGYGYINYTKETAGEDPIHKVISFKEKPDLVTAKTYLDSGDYLWNAGMFVWSVPTILKSYQINAPQILEVLMQQNALYGTADEQAYIDAVYPDTQKISVDYAILERADNVYTIPADIGWSDLGTWNSLHAFMSNGTDVVSVGQNIHLVDSKDIIVISNNHKQIVIKGLKDYIVVDEENALLIYPKSDEQEIKGVVEDLIKVKVLKV